MSGSLLEGDKWKRALIELERISSQLNLSNYTKNEVMLLYSKLTNQNSTRGRPMERILGSLIYYVCKRDNNPIIMHEISKALDIEEKHLFKTYKILKKKLKLKKILLNPENLIYKYNDGLKLSQPTLTLASKILKKFYEKGAASKPRVLVASALLLATKKTREHRYLSKIAKVCDVTGVGLRHCVKISKHMI